MKKEKGIMERSGLMGRGVRGKSRRRCWRRDRSTKDVSKGHKKACYFIGLLKIIIKKKF